MVTLGIFIAALIGFFISCYIAYKKIKHEKLFCPLGKQCNDVVYSEYNKMFGIQNEILGVIYYGLVAIVFGASLFGVWSAPTILNLFFLIAALCAVVFSVYLIFVQAIILKKWCEWCIASAILSLTIFILMLSGYAIS